MPNDGDERPIPFLMSRWKLWKDSCQAERRRFYAGRRLAVIGKTHCDGCRAKALRQQSLQSLSAANSSLDDADSSRPGGIGQQPPEHAFQDRSQPFSPKISVRAFFASKYRSIRSYRVPTKKPSRRTGSAPSAKRIPPGMCRRIRPVLSISSKPLNATIPVFMPRA